MNDIIVRKSISAMTLAQVDKVRYIESCLEKRPQLIAPIEQFIHAGMYARTILLHADRILTGALIKIPTILIVSGNAIVYIGDDTKTIIGYHVMPAEPHRKQIFIAAEDTHITMLFPTTVKTVREAEEQFTDEFHRLTTRKEG